MSILLGDICNVTTGQSAPQDKTAFTEEGTPFIRAGSLEGLLAGKSEEGFELINKENAKKFRLKLFPENTVVFAKSGMSAKLGRVYRLKRPCYLVSHLAAVIPSEKLDPGYLHRWFEKNPPSKLIDNDAYPSIKTSVIQQIEIPLPPLTEQKRIAAILDKADAIRRKRQAAIKLADDFLRATFLYMFGDPVTNPKGFKSTKLVELVEKKRGISYGVVQRGKEYINGVPIVRISNIVTNTFNPTPIVLTDPAIESKFRRTRLIGGELLISIRGTVGRVAIVPPLAKNWNVSREVAVIPLLPGVNRKMIHQLLQTQGVQDFLTENIKGVAQSGINLSDLRELPIPVPPKEIIQLYSGIQTMVESFTLKITEKIKLSEYLFNSLSQRAFRGEL